VDPGWDDSREDASSPDGGVAGNETCGSGRDEAGNDNFGSSRDDAGDDCFGPSRDRAGNDGLGLGCDRVGNEGSTSSAGVGMDEARIRTVMSAGGTRTVFCRTGRSSVASVLSGATFSIVFECGEAGILQE